MVRNGSVPHDVSHQLVQEGGMLEKGEEDLKKQARFPDLSISNDSLKTTFLKTEQILKSMCQECYDLGVTISFCAPVSQVCLREEFGPQCLHEYVFTNFNILFL